MNPEPNNDNPNQVPGPDVSSTPAQPFTPNIVQSTATPPIQTTPQTPEPQPQVTGIPQNPQPASQFPPSGPNKSGKKKKAIIISSVIAFLIVLLGAGYVFGYYIPNKPENVYKTGFDRTGKAVDKLVNEGLEADKMESFKSSEFSGNVEVEAAGGKYSGSFNSKYDSKKSDTTATYKNPNEDVNLQVLSNLQDGKLYPDIYFKLSGLKALGLEEFVPQLADYDNKWISVSSDYLASVIPAEVQDETDAQDFSQEDAANLARIVTDKTREYVFTSNPDKAVVEQKSFVGTEQLDGDIAANHYTVALNKENTKKYCKALIESVTASESYKKVPGINVDTLDEDKKQAIEDCDKSIDRDIKDTDTFDLWVDKKTKLIHKIRVTDENDKGTYLEVGQTYKSGSNIPLFVTLHSDEGKYDLKLTMDVDTEKSITKGSLNFTYDDTDKYTAKADFEFKPYSGEIKTDKPEGTVSIEDVMKAFNFDPSALQQDVQAEEDNLL